MSDRANMLANLCATARMVGVHCVSGQSLWLAQIEIQTFAKLFTTSNYLSEEKLCLNLYLINNFFHGLCAHVYYEHGSNK